MIKKTGKIVVRLKGEDYADTYEYHQYDTIGEAIANLGTEKVMDMINKACEHQSQLIERNRMIAENK